MFPKIPGWVICEALSTSYYGTAVGMPRHEMAGAIRIRKHVRVFAINR